MEHYPRNTCRITKWCPTCNKVTFHRVDNKRVGICTEHRKEGLSKEQEKREEKRIRDEQNPTLF